MRRTNFCSIIAFLLCGIIFFASCAERGSITAQHEVIPQQPDYADASQWYTTNRGGEADIFY